MGSRWTTGGYGTKIGFMANRAAKWIGLLALACVGAAGVGCSGSSCGGKCAGPPPYDTRQVTPDEQTALGFSASDVRKQLGGPWTGTLAWIADPSTVTANPASGTTGVSIVLGDAFNERAAIIYEPSASYTDAAVSFLHMEVPVHLLLATVDGALDTDLLISMRATSATQASVLASLDAPGTVGGTYAATAVDSARYLGVSSQLALDFVPAGATGTIVLVGYGTSKGTGAGGSDSKIEDKLPVATIAAALDAPDGGVRDSGATADGSVDGSVDGPGDTAACWYTRSGGGTTASHFRFSFIAPDQATYACSYDPAKDAGPPWPRDLSGVTTSVASNQFTIDTCLAGDACDASLYTFILDAPGVRLTMPVGRQVRVKWQFTGGWYCAHWLAVYDAEPGQTDVLWLLGNGGFQASVTDLPFDVALQRLDCRLPADAYRTSCSGEATGDYAFRFASTYGPASSLVLGTLESGAFAFQTSGGAQETMDIHCLDAFQTIMCDDYWNWDYWAVKVAEAADGSAPGGTL